MCVQYKRYNFDLLVLKIKKKKELLMIDLNQYSFSQS